MANHKLPERIMAWHHHELLSHVGTWATTRYPEDAEEYVPASQLSDARQRAEAAEARLKELKKALTPSTETKAAYICEFSVPLPDKDEDGNEVMRHINVPWITIKEIMSAIRNLAEIKGAS